MTEVLAFLYSAICVGWFAFLAWACRDDGGHFKWVLIVVMSVLWPWSLISEIRYVIRTRQTRAW